MAWVNSPDAELDSLVETVAAKMTGNVYFTTPDPPLASITAANDTFRLKVTAMQQGGTQATADRDAARAVLVGLLRQLVVYIEKEAQNDEVKLRSTGFDVDSSDHSTITLTKPAIQGIDFGVTGSVILHCGAMGSAKFLLVQTRTGGGAWVDALVSTQARNIVVPKLVSGQMYDFRVQAGAGGGQVSDWSDPVSHLAP